MRFDMHDFASLADAVAWAREEIDKAAGMARARYVTVAPGQDATYSAKYSDALAFIRAGCPADDIAQYPWIKMEAESTGQSYADAAANIKAVGDPWNAVIGPAIEGLRIGGKKQLSVLTNIANVLAHTRMVVDKLALV